MSIAEMVRHMCRHPDMYVSPTNLATVTAYLSGFNQARDGGPLCGFREWLIVRLNGGDNRVWESLAPQIFPTVAEQVGFDPEDEGSQIRALGAVLETFFEFRDKQGLTKIFHEYGKWLLRHQWYTGPLRQIRD